MKMKTSNTKQMLMYVPICYPFIRTQLFTIYGQYLPEKGVYSTFVAPSLKGKGKIFKKKTGRIEFVIVSNRFKHCGLHSFILSQFNFLRQVLVIKKLLNEGNFQILQIRNSILMGFFGLYFRYKNKVKLVFQYSFPNHLTYLNVGLLRNFKFLQLKSLIYLLNRMDYVLPISKWMKNDLIKAGLKNNHVIPLRLGLDQNFFAKLKTKSERRNLDTKTVKFICIGTMAYSRKLDVILKAIKNVLSSTPGKKFIVLFVGEGSDKDNLVDLSIKLGITEYVKFLGFLEHEKAMELLSTCDYGICMIPETPVFVVSSPTRLYEYLACGIPVIASRLPENRIVLQECKAGLITDFSIGSLTLAMRKILLGYVTFPSRVKIREYSMENHSYGKRASEIASIYTDD